MHNPSANQMISLAQVSLPRLTIMSNETKIPMIGVNGIHGATNARGTSVPRLRRIHTPAHTMTNARSVPIETSSPSTLIGVKAATVATHRPTRIVEMYGVRNRGWILHAHGGSSPSLDIEKNTRDCPNSITTMVELRPQIAPSFTRMLPQLTPVMSMPIAIGSGTSSAVYFTNPVNTAATRM